MRTIRGQLGSILIGVLVAALATVSAGALRAQPQFTPAELAGLTPVALTNCFSQGNYYFLYGPDPERSWPPLPGPPRDVPGDTPVYDLGDGFFLIDDSAVDWSAIRAQEELDTALMQLEAESQSSLAGTSAGGGPLSPLGDGDGCVTNGPVYLTNLFVTDISTQSCTVTMTVGGGTNGVSYSLYSAIGLVAELTNAAWGWRQYVYCCDTVALTNESVGATFYVLAGEKDTDGDGMPDSWEVLHGLNPFDPSDASWDPDDDGLTCYQEYTNSFNPFDPMLIAWGNNARSQSTVPWGFPGVTAMAAGGGAGSGGFTLVVTNQGRVAAWGANEFGQTDVPVGLSNVVAVAAGGNQAACLRACFENTLI